MELFIGLVVIAVAVYFIFFRKKEEVASVSVADVAAKAEVVETVKSAPAAKKPATATKKPAAKKPTVKKATTRKPKAK